jgi:large subunit ribosomal protein L18
MNSRLSNFERRRQRTRTALRKVANGRPRLSVHRSSANIYAQVIDDATGRTLVSASTLDSAFKKSGKSGNNIAAATEIGRIVAEAAIKGGVKQVVFDRGGFIYHGRVKALADAARDAGLEF